MDVIKDILFAAPFLKILFHRDFHHVVSRMTLIDKLLFLVVHTVDKFGMWHRLPVFLGLAYLLIRRYLHDGYNLLNVGTTPVGVRFNPADYPYRKSDGKLNDPFNEGVGNEGTFFGRNIPPAAEDNNNKVGLVSKILDCYVTNSQTVMPN